MIGSGWEFSMFNSDTHIRHWLNKKVLKEVLEVMWVERLLLSIVVQ
jgi:hypothetical protein